MTLRFSTVIGVTYVAIIAVVAAFCIPSAFNSVVAGEGEAGRLVEQAQSTHQLDRGLPGSQGLPAVPEYVNGKPVKYRIGKDGARAETETPRKQEANVTPSNYLAIWTADWCPYCPKMKSLGEKLEAEGFCVVYLDFDANRDEAKRLGIIGIPTAVVYDAGAEILRVNGMNSQSEAQIRGVLRKDIETPDDYDIY